MLQRGSFCYGFDLHLATIFHKESLFCLFLFCLFLSGRFTQVLLYTLETSYIQLVVYNLFLMKYSVFPDQNFEKNYVQSVVIKLNMLVHNFKPLA